MAVPIVLLLASAAVGRVETAELDKGLPPLQGRVLMEGKETGPEQTINVYINGDEVATSAGGDEGATGQATGQAALCNFLFPFKMYECFSKFNKHMWQGGFSKEDYAEGIPEVLLNCGPTHFTIRRKDRRKSTMTTDSFENWATTENGEKGPFPRGEDNREGAKFSQKKPYCSTDCVKEKWTMTGWFSEPPFPLWSIQRPESSIYHASWNNGGLHLGWVSEDNPNHPSMYKCGRWTPIAARDEPNEGYEVYLEIRPEGQEEVSTLPEK